MGALSKLQRGFTSEDHDYLKVVQAIRNQGQKVLYQVLLWGWPVGVAHTELGNHVLSKADKVFNKTDKDNINSCSTGESYDVTLLHKVIRAVCRDVAPFNDKAWSFKDETKLEFLITKIKNKRNDIYHSVEEMDKSTMMTEMEEIRSLLCNAISAAGVRFAIDPHEVTKVSDTINHNINLIRTAKLARDDINTYQKELLHEHLTKILKQKGPKELKLHVKKISVLNPFHFLDGSDYFLEVGDVFSSIEVERAGKDAANKEIDYKDLFRLSEESENIVQIPGAEKVATLLLIEGEAGFGKTTLFKFILADWERGAPSINALKSYDLVLPLMCRDSHVSDFGELLTFLMPDTMKSFQTVEEFVACAHDLRLLVLVDGLDEMTTQSRKVLKDLLSRKKIRDMTVLCTSRPETVKSFYKMVPSELSTVLLKIKGVPEDCRGMFLQKYHDEMIKKKKSDKSTQGLVEYINRTSSKLQHHFRSPLNLILLTHLWSVKSDLVNDVTTATELYLHVDKLRIEKLMEKVAATESARDSLAEDCVRFEKTLLLEALICISNNQIQLPESSKERLRKICSDLELSFSAVLYHFLVMKATFTESGRSEAISFPHLDIHDYYGASCIYFALWRDDYFHFMKNYIPKGESGSLYHQFLCLFKSSKKSAILPPVMTDVQSLTNQRTITEVLEAVHNAKIDTVDLKRYRNVFKHLAGLLGQHMHEVPEDLALELLKFLSRSGLVSREDWLDILREVKCDATTAKYIANFVCQSLKGHVYISDKEVGIYASLMPYATPRKVTLELASNPREIARLPELLKAVGCHENIHVDLKFHHDFHHCQKSDALLGHLKSGSLKCNPVVLIGHISNPDKIPSTIEELSLSLENDDQAIQLKDFITSVQSALPKIQKLELLLGPNLTMSAMPKMPDLETPPALHLPTLDQSLFQSICNMLSGIRNEKGFSSINFSKCSLTLEDSKEFVNMLKAANIKITDTLTLPSPNLADHADDLKAIVEGELACKVKLRGISS